MDKLVPGYLKSYANVAVEQEKDHDVCYGNYHKIQQICEQLAYIAKSATHSPHVGLEDMDRLLQFGDVLKKELDQVRVELSRRKNLELLLPSPNTQHHLPCSSMLSPTSPAPSSPTTQQSMAMSTNASTSSPGSLGGIPQSPTGSTSPHSMMDNSSMSITSTGVMQADSEYWRSRKMDPTKIVRRSPTPLYVNLTEQMILAQSSKRKRPAEGDLYCHNCKTKDTPEWRRGPMGAKTLCNACGIRWRLSQAEATKQKKSGDQLSPTQSPGSIQYPIMGMGSPQSPQSSPSTSPTNVPTPMQVQQSLLQQQQQHLRQQQQLQQQLQQQQQQQLHHQLQQQYNQSHAHHNLPHPQQQHMVVPGPVGLAQENIPTRLALSGDATANRSASVLLSLTPSPIAT